MAKKAKQLALQEPDHEELNSFIENNPEVHNVAVCVKRRKKDGSTPVVKWEVKPITEIATKEFDEWMMECFGGGEYIINVMDHRDTKTRLLTPFKLFYPGEPKLTPNQEQRLKEQWKQAAATFPPGMVPPAFGGGYTPPTMEPAPGGLYQKWLEKVEAKEAKEGNTLDPRNLVSYTSDQMAMTTIQRLEQELKEERQQRTQEREQFDKARQEWDARFQQLQSQIAETQVQAREESMRRELEAVKEQLRTREERKAPAVDYVGLASALAPVLVQLYSANNERAKLQQEQQHKMLEQSAKSTDTVVKLMEQNTKAGAEETRSLVPMMIEMIKGKDPGKQAQLVSSVMESNMTMMSMLSEVVNSMAGESQSPWVHIVQEGIKGVMEAAQAMSESVRGNGHDPAAEVASVIARRGQAAQQPQSQSQPQPQPQPQEAQQQQAPPAPRSPEELVERVMQDPSYPRDLKSGAWRKILIQIHTGGAAPEELADVVAGHLFDLERLDMIPETFEGVMSDPENVLGDFVMRLPIAKMAPDYAQSLIASFGQIVQQEGAEEPADDAEATEDAEAELQDQSQPNDAVDAEVISEPEHA